MLQMLTLFLMSMLMAVSSALILAASPLFLGAWIILMALISAMLLTSSSATWLGMMMFLIYVGGLLVMFAYFVALTPNLLIEGKSMMYASASSTMLFLIALHIMDLSDQKVLSSQIQLPLKFLLSENPMAVSFLAMILFFALVATVKMCKSTSSPLRPFN